MNPTARISTHLAPRLHPAVGAAVLAAAVLSLGPAGSASARPAIGKDGKIRACYKVKGKPRGALRVVKGRKVRCKRGERKVAWTARGAVGQRGADGAQGAAGQPGAAGTYSSDLASQVESLAARVAALEGQVTSLEATLAGVTNADLTGALNTVEGLTNEDLTSAVNALPTVESLCTQTSTLTAQVNQLAQVIEGLGLNGVLEALGGVLEIPALPPELEPFACSVP